MTAIASRLTDVRGPMIPNRKVALWPAAMVTHAARTPDTMPTNCAMTHCVAEALLQQGMSSWRVSCPEPLMVQRG
eukprot:6129483-Amphidinium_carterae.1